MTQNPPPATEVIGKLLQGYISTSEASKRSGFHQRTVTTWIHKGLLPAVRLPGKRGQYFINPEDLEELLRRMFTPQPYNPKGKHGNPSK